MSQQKRIGILTSGGDCAGLNAVLRAVTYRAIDGYGWKVFGINEGTNGLLRRPVEAEELGLRIFTGGVLRMAGTILGTTNKGDPFAYPMGDGTIRDRSDEIIAGYHELGLDALIAVGGDGSLQIIRRIAQKGGINLVGIPKTIDNDVAVTDLSVGFSTGVFVATEALDRLQPTGASHNRVMVLEVMGRDAGHIALQAGIAGGADVILIPEIPWRIEPIAEKIGQLRRAGRTSGLVVVSEAIKTEAGHQVKASGDGEALRYGGVGHYVGRRITEASGAETRVTVLGHVQRGGQPTPQDRLIASAFGVHAVDLVARGSFDRMVAWSHRRCIDVPLVDAIARNQVIDPDSTLVHTARGLGICLGDR